MKKVTRRRTNAPPRDSIPNDPLLFNLEGLGNVLVALRIARGLSQRALAERLGIHQSQVSRDERNDYNGATVERAAHVLDALRVEMKSSFRLTPGRGAANRRASK